MKNKYRIKEVRKNKHVKYLIQIKRWWIPFWYTKVTCGIFNDEFNTLTAAKNRLEYIKSPTIKRVVHED